MVVSENIGSINSTNWTVEFRWKINKLCYIGCCKDSRDSIKSPMFVTKHVNEPDLHWYMQLYPKGMILEVNKYMSFQLCCNLWISNAVVTLAILNKKGEAAVNCTHLRVDNHNYVKKTWQSEQFVLRSFIHDPVNGIIDADEFTILCTIKFKALQFVIDLPNETKNQKDEEVQEDDLSFHENIYEALLDDSKFSDVALTAEGKTIKVYKGILAKSSSVFASMFENEMKKLENTVEITDVTYDVLMEMLRFVYVGKVNNIDTFAGELAIAADKYALEKLKNKCEKTMAKNLTIDNVVQCLQLADSIHMNKLKENAIDFIVKNATVTEKPEFRSLSNDLVMKICQALARKGM